jgi:broad specificity phosphatase PhoE
MPDRLIYLTHPQVEIDPQAPVPEWGLSFEGRARALALAGAEGLAGVSRIVSSQEAKAVETAEILAQPLRLAVETRARLGENDRSATGYLPPEEFETVADAFFAHPDESVRGWERAIEAQARIVGETRVIVAERIDGAARHGDILLVGHGGVGTLLYCHLAAVAISRAHDQPLAGGGCYFAAPLDTLVPEHGWRPMEDLG